MCNHDRAPACTRTPSHRSPDRKSVLLTLDRPSRVASGCTSPISRETSRKDVSVVAVALQRPASRPWTIPPRRIAGRDLPIYDPLDWHCELLQELTHPPSSPTLTRMLRLPPPWGFEQQGMAAGGRGVALSRLVTASTTRIYSDRRDLLEVRRWDRTGKWAEGGGF